MEPPRLADMVRFVARFVRLSILSNIFRGPGACQIAAMAWPRTERALRQPPRHRRGPQQSHRVQALITSIGAPVPTTGTLRQQKPLHMAWEWELRDDVSGQRSI